MSPFDIFAVLITLAAVFAYLNHRLLKLPATIGLMILAMLLSVVLLAVGKVSPGFYELARSVIGSIDFYETLMHGNARLPALRGRPARQPRRPQRAGGG